MPRPTPDRVIHDWTFAILPVAAGFVLIILTVVTLVYSIGVKTAIPEGLAIPFAGLAYGLFGLWMAGHLVRYCRGHYTRGAVAAPATPPPLPLTSIATGADGAAMAAPLVSQAAGASFVLPISCQQPQQQSRQDQQDHRQQQRQYTQQYRSRPNQEQYNQQQQYQREPRPRPHVQSPPSPSPQGQFPQQRQPQREQQEQQQQQQQQQQQRYYQQRDQQPPPQPQNARRPNDPRITLLNQVPPVLRPGPKQRQPPSDPSPRTDRKPSPMQRTSSLQLTPVEVYSGCRSHSLDVQRPLHRENRQVSRGPRAPGAPSDGVAGRHTQGNQSRVTPHHGDVERDPRRTSTRSASLDSGTRQSLQARTSRLPVVKPFGSEYSIPGQPAPLAVAPLKIRKGGDQGQASSLGEPYSSAWVPAGQHMHVDQQAGQARPSLHGPRPQPHSDRRTNGPTAIRMVIESPPGNGITATQPGQAEVRGRHLVPDPAPPSPSPSAAQRFEDIDHPGVQRTAQTSSAFQTTADETPKHVSRERVNANPATNLVILPTYIFAHGQVVAPERSNAGIFGILFEEADDEKPSDPESELRYKHDSGIIVEGPDSAKRSSTPSSRWSSWSSRSWTTSRSGRSG